MRSCGVATLAGLRSLALMISGAGIGLGAWILYTIHDVEIRSSAILDTSQLNDGQKGIWQAFFDGAVSSQVRIWIEIASSSFTLLTLLFICLSLRQPRLRTSPLVLIPLEFLCMLAMTAAFATSLTLALKLEPLCRPLDSSSEGDLMAFRMLCPMSRVLASVSGAGCLFLTLSVLTTLIQTCQQRQKQKVCSFEPTASSLGMSHGYQAVVPPTTSVTIPTLYDPRKPMPGTAISTMDTDVVGVRDLDRLERTDSGITNASYEEKEISGPMGLEKPDDLRAMRPARPWSEAPKRKG